MSEPVRHLAMLDATWCGESYDQETCTLDPGRSTCERCLVAAMDFGDRALQRLRRITAAGIAPGAIVEWIAHRGERRRAIVHRIEDGRIYIRWPRRPTTRNPNPYNESWFEQNEECHLLRVVPS